MSCMLPSTNRCESGRGSRPTCQSAGGHVAGLQCIWAIGCGVGNVGRGTPRALLQTERNTPQARRTPGSHAASHAHATLNPTCSAPFFPATSASPQPLACVSDISGRQQMTPHYRLPLIRGRGHRGRQTGLRPPSPQSRFLLLPGPNRSAGQSLWCCICTCTV